MNRHPAIRIVLAALPVAVLCSVAPAGAQDYPSKPVRIIVPFAPGGSSDLLARYFAHGLSEKLGQQFVVENRAGAAGNVGTDVVAKAAPDGYVLGYSTSGPLANNKFLYKSMPFDSEKAFTPIVLVGEIPLVIAANPALPAKNLKELVDYARANPGKVSAGHPGNGTIGHLALELLKMNTGTNMVGVPYKGDVPVMSDAVAGVIQIGLAPVTAFIPQIQAGKLRGIALTSKARLDSLPNVPTATQQGFEIEATVWSGFVGPAGLPRPIVDKVNAEVNRMLDSAEGRAQLAKYATLLAGGAPEKMGQLMASDAAKWKRVIETAKVTVE